jgi:hypothetical protein
MGERRVLKVTHLMEVEVEGMTAAELSDLKGQAVALMEQGLAQEPGGGPGLEVEVHGTASAAEWVGSDFYSASRAEGFPV